MRIFRRNSPILAPQSLLFRLPLLRLRLDRCHFVASNRSVFARRRSNTRFALLALLGREWDVHGAGPNLYMRRGNLGLGLVLELLVGIIDYQAV